MSSELERDVLVCALQTSRETARTLVTHTQEIHGIGINADHPAMVALIKVWQNRAMRLENTIEALDAIAGQPRCVQCGGPAFLRDGLDSVSAIYCTSGMRCNKCGAP